MKSHLINTLMLALGLGLLAATGPARASTGAAPSVGADRPACETLATSALAFGAYDPTADMGVTASTSLQVKCSAGTVVTVSVDVGGTQARRPMAKGGDAVEYDGAYERCERPLAVGRTIATHAKSMTEPVALMTP